LGGHTATVFGATGFLGRYIVNRLARQGVTVVVPFREEMAKRHLKLMGDLGKVNFMEYDLRNTASLEESVRHSDMVFNLVGRDYSTKNFSLEDVHVEGAERIAEAVAKYDVDRFIHVSSYNVDRNSPSEFFRTKAHGEEVVRSIFPETTIVRPAPLFGFEDQLLHKLAGVTNLFTCNNMQERFWPVHAIDVGAALEKIGFDDNTASQTYELYGPTNYSMEEIAEMVDREIIKKRRHINVPKAIMKPAATVLNKLLWWQTFSGDVVEREFIDQVIDPSAKTFKDLDMEPAELKSLIYHYVVRALTDFCSVSMLIMRNSKITVVQRSLICRQRRNVRRGRRRSICTFLMTNRGLYQRTFVYKSACTTANFLESKEAQTKTSFGIAMMHSDQNFPLHQ
jgi:NADH dehydrogenase (ubiquinone) 1 alpha subcomplex subunit 9